MLMFFNTCLPLDRVLLTPTIWYMYSRRFVSIVCACARGGPEEAAPDLPPLVDPADLEPPFFFPGLFFAFEIFFAFKPMVTRACTE